MAIKLKFTDNAGKTVKEVSISDILTGSVDKLFDFAEANLGMENKQTSITEVKEYYQNMKHLIAEVFEGHCTFEEIQAGVTQSEIFNCYNALMKHIGVTIKRKN